MARITDPSEACPFHRAYDAIKQSEPARLVATAQVASLRVLRDLIDRRLAQLDEKDRPASEEKVRIRVKGG